MLARRYGRPLEDMRTHLIIAGPVRDVASSGRVLGGRVIVRPVPGSAACGAAAERPAEVARLPRRDQRRESGGLGVAEVLRQLDQQRGQASPKACGSCQAAW